MLRNLLSLIAVSSTLFLGSSLIADTFHKEVRPELHQVVATDLYAGDQNGDFVGDIVAVLDDGSCWKIHPTRVDKFLAWDLDDILHVGVRTDFYWFSRQHEFQLVNHTKNEKIKVMLVNMPTEAPHILTSETYVESSYYTTRTYVDFFGNSYTSLEKVYVYAKRLILTDGTMWRIKSNFKGFLVGDAIYVGTHMKKKTGSHLLISGKEKHAEWAWAERLY